MEGWRWTGGGVGRVEEEGVEGWRGGGVEGWAYHTAPNRQPAIPRNTYRSKAVPHRTDVKQP